MNAVNRRRFERFTLQPMYTDIRVREAGAEARSGHAYDVSEGGLCFELDDAIAPGTPVTIEIALPTPIKPGALEIAPEQTVVAQGRVVWADDDGARGPVRMAACFTGFAEAGDRERLLGRFATKTLSRAA